MFLFIGVAAALTTLSTGIEVNVFRNITSTFTPKIVNGLSAQRREIPYQISYQLKSYRGYHHVCGGSILNSYWILTAGHCLLGTPLNTRVVAGLLYQRENHPDNQIVEVEKQICHPRYPTEGGVAPYDIALLKLKTPLRFTEAVKPIGLPRNCETENGFALLTGWGFMSSSRPVVAPVLQKITLPLLTHMQCRNSLILTGLSASALDPTMICAGQLTGDDGVCSGDSGGPMVQRGKLLGVASWTCQPCGTPHCPSVYTKVCAHKDFIEKNVQNVTWG